MQAFGIAVHTKEAQGNEATGANHMLCPLNVEGRPESIKLQIQAKGNGITPIAIHGSQPYEYSDQLNFELEVPVEWRQLRGLWVPHTRQAGRDNVDIILIDESLHFRDIQISLLSRKGRFYIVAQRVYEGWMRIQDDEVRFLPSLPVFAYPGADYRATWKGMGNVLAIMARLVHSILDPMGASLKDPSPATWEPQRVEPLKEWGGGHVLFFNPVTNTGRILGENGVTYHVYGNNLVNVRGNVHMLEPMAPVYFRRGQQEKGQPFISVRSCKPAY